MERLKSSPAKRSLSGTAKKSNSSIVRSNKRVNDDCNGNESSKITRRKRRRKRKNPKDDEEALIDEAIEEKLQECARKNNLSHLEMKKLLRKIVGNEHVLALVRIQEDEELARERERKMKESLEKNAFSESDNPNLLKLTRAKARELNKKPIPLPPLNEIEPEPEIAALISQDLHSDEEDEEYHPQDEDLVSDDDPNTTISDYDSAPPTPSTIHLNESPIKLAQDGPFKIPRTRNDSLSQQEEIIAKRTRSKLCLERTPIETIESKFIPPDITTDMYEEADYELDTEWIEFLSQFTKPLNATTNEEDDEADPEYVAADKVPVDKEELKDVNISKKELSDLITELFDGLLSSEEITLENEPLLETPQKIVEKSPNKTPENLEKQKQKETTPEIQLPKNEPQVQTPSLRPVNNQGNETATNNSPFIPETASTPFVSYEQNYAHPNGLNSVEMMAPPLQDQSPDTSFTNITSLHQPPVYFSTIHKLEQYSPQSASGVSPCLPPSNCSSSNNSFQSSNNSIVLPPVHAPIMSSQSLLWSDFPAWYQMPSPYRLPTQNSFPMYVNNCTVPFANASNMSLQSIGNSTPKETSIERKQRKSVKDRFFDDPNNLPYEKWRNDSYVSITKHIRSEYAKKYELLKYETVQYPLLSEEKTGFTELQRNILDQQMRIHVQFAAQNFLQTYSHPEYWKFSKQEKEFLLDLEEQSKGDLNSSFNAWNLKPALKLIEDWEKELSVNNEDNRILMDFMFKQIEKVKSVRSHHTTPILEFPPRIMKLIIESPVFIYSDKLPRIPFRVTIRTPNEQFFPAEDHLIALGMEKFYEEIRKEKEKYPNRKRKIGDLRLVAERISREFLVGKSPLKIWLYIRRKTREKDYNAIKFYYDRQKAPPCNHNLQPFDPSRVLPPKERISELSLIWREFVSSIKETTSSSTTGKEFVNNSKKEIKGNSPSDSNEIKTENNVNYFVNIKYVINENLQLRPIVEIKNTNATLQEEFQEDSIHQAKFLNSSTILPSSDINETPSAGAFEKSTPEKENCSAAGNRNSSISKRKRCPRKYHQLKEDGISAKRSLNKLLLKNKERKFLKRKIFINVIAFKSATCKSVEFAENVNVQKVHSHFKALEKYSEFLIDFKMSCKKLKSNMEEMNINNQHTGCNMASSSSPKRAKLTNFEPNENINNSNNNLRSKKSQRANEYMRKMLTPEKVNEVDRKDAIYALNFYDKVEEKFKRANRHDGFKKFQSIIKSFDPQTDSVPELYLKMEKIFLPHYPELAEIFLTFLLPSEAAEVGKFYAHFMLTNMGNFINKLNLYFSKQPAQLKKVYTALSELSNENNISMEKIKEKILPLLKGNQFLIDWFLEIFPNERPPKGMITVPENVNFKGAETCRNLNNYENFPQTELFPDNQDSPTCQTRYVDGRLFYGSKVLLPGKLAFMAEELITEENSSENETREVNDPQFKNRSEKCLHGFRDFAERQLQQMSESSDENPEKPDEDELKVFNSENEKRYTMCDESTLRLHAIRLNPSLYDSNSKDPNPRRLSPKKQIKSNLSIVVKDRKKSPKKNFTRSPNFKRMNQSATEKSYFPLTEGSCKILNTAKKIRAMTEMDSLNDDQDHIEDFHKINDEHFTPEEYIQSVKNEENSEDNNNNNEDENNNSSEDETSIDPISEHQEEFNENKDECCCIDALKEENQDSNNSRENTVTPKKTFPWTREEDKIILEEAKFAFNNEKQRMKNLREKLPDRTEDELRQRHHFLMDVLNKLTHKN